MLTYLAWYLEQEGARQHWSLTEVIREALRVWKASREAPASDRERAMRVLRERGDSLREMKEPPPPGVARRSCPWRGTARWRRRVRCGPDPAGRSRHTACRGQGGSGPRVGACRVRWPG